MPREVRYAAGARTPGDGGRRRRQAADRAQHARAEGFYVLLEARAEKAGEDSDEYPPDSGSVDRSGYRGVRRAGRLRAGELFGLSGLSEGREARYVARYGDAQRRRGQELPGVVGRVLGQRRSVRARLQRARPAQRRIRLLLCRLGERSDVRIFPFRPGRSFTRWSCA